MPTDATSNAPEPRRMNTSASPSEGIPEIAEIVEIVELRREIALLRRETRTARLLGGLATGGLLLGLVAMSNPAPFPVLQTRRLEIVDDAGRVTLLASTSPQGGRLDLWDKSGANVARVGANDLGGDLVLWSNAGKTAFSAFAQAAGGRVEVGTSAGGMAAYLDADVEGGRLALHAGGKPLFGAGAFPAGGLVRIGDRENRDAAILAAGANGNALSLYAPNGTATARLRGDGDAGSLEVAAPTGPNRVEIAATASEARAVASSNAGSARVAAGKLGGGVEVVTPRGDRVVALETNDDGGLLVCRGEGDRPLASLGASPSGGRGGLLQIYNREQSPVFAAAVNSDGAGRLALGTSAGVATFVAESGKDDGASMSLLRGGKRAIAMISATGGGLLNLFGSAGQAIVVAGPAEDADGGLVVVRSTQGKDLARIGVDDAGAGNVVLFNQDATERRELSGPR